MIGFGDRIVFLSAVFSLIYAIYSMAFQKVALYFKMIVGAMFCHFLGCLYDVCEYYTTGMVAENFTIGYFGTIGCFLFFLTANFGYLDGIVDDKSATVKRSRILALLAPVVLFAILIPNFFAEIPIGTKICYTLVWIPAMFSSYFNLKHAIIPDMGFSFVKAIRPFNITALLFTLFQLIHLTLWNFSGWIPLLVSGILLGASSILMMIFAQRGVKKWAI